MSSVLVIDDDQAKGEDIRDSLRKAGFMSELVCEEYLGDFFERLRRNELQAQVWDAIVFDILFRKNRWGGVFLYNKLVGSGLRNRWKETIIYTRYAGDNVAGATEGEQFILRVFADTAQIPFECVLPNFISGRTNLITKLNDIGVR